MRRLLIISFILLCCHSLVAQVNYVLNPSLEEFTRCPLTFDEIMYAKFWSPIDSAWHIYGLDTQGNGNCSAEYCNTCDTFSTSQLQIPANGLFNSYPRCGKGMAEVLMFLDSTYIGSAYQRDYLQGRLYKTLTLGKSYCVAFYVKLNNRGGAEYAVNSIGAYLDNGHIDAAPNSCGLVQTQYIPQIIENSVISDTTRWIKIEGAFTALGTEKFITIGNFNDLVNTSHIISNPTVYTGGSYYLIDDVSVIESDTKAFAWANDTLHKGYLDSILIGRNETIPGIKWYRDGILIDTLNAGIWIKDSTLGNYHKYVLEQTLCGLTTYDTVVVSVELTTAGVPPSRLKGELKIYPNPATNTIYIDAAEKVHASILSLDGRELQSSTDAKSIDISSLAPGCYLLRVYDEQHRLLRTEKLLKMSR